MLSLCIGLLRFISYLRHLKIRTLVICAGMGCCGLFTAAAVAQPSSPPAAEEYLQKVLSRIAASQFDAAQDDIDQLLEQYPNFRLAHLIKGDLLLARARPLTTLGNLPDTSAPQLNGLREEAIARLRAYNDPPPDNAIPRNLLLLGAEQRHAVVVDTRRARLYVYRNDKGRPRLVRDFYASHGKAGADKMREGDNRTPLGVYHITSFIPPARLPDFYGKGAFPLNYPNEWDKQQGRTGHGIWLHGTPSDTYARPPKASEGCVVLANQDFTRLSDYIEPGITPVIISDNLEWIDLDAWEAERSDLTQAIESWRKDWESLEVERYLAHYSPAFRAGKTTYADWTRQKRRIASQRSWIKVNLDKLSILRNPGQEDLFVVTFEQQYRSDDHKSTTRKRQYWLRENKQWKIIFEETA